MKKIVATIISWLLICTPAQAISPVNTGLIRDAQEYGIKNAKQDAGEFLLPWAAYEERAAIKSELKEFAYLYTPYLLIALYTKDNDQNGLKPRLEDIERVLADYNGFLTFEATIYGNTPDFTSKIMAWLYQGKKKISYYQVAFSSKPAAVTDHTGKKIYKAQGYIYFTDKNLNSEKPVTLIIAAADKRERWFNFDLAKLR